MELYFSPFACSLASHITAREAGIPLQLTAVTLSTKRTASGADFLAVSPKGQVPALRLDDGSLLTENPAVLQYLADAAPATASSTDEVASGQDAQTTDEATTAQPSIMDGLKVLATNGHAAAREERLSIGQPTVIFDTADSPACSDCGSIMVRNGSCYKCLNCGSTSGCS